MNHKYKFVFFLLLAVNALLLFVLLVQGNNVAVLNPKGLIAGKEKELLMTAVLLSLTMIIPVFILTFFISWKYRESNHKATYTPDWTHNKSSEIVIWAIPCVIILILATIIWKSTHALDPFKPITTNTKPLTIQVVALEWKWLFIYPQQHIATVNFVEFPESTPINFQLTADNTPMNSFWIPQLGGQMYAMTGMSTQLHLMANTPGDFPGAAAEINGSGFSGMKFVARASSQADFNKWVQGVKQSNNTLSLDQYHKLTKPSENNPVEIYSSTEMNLYNEIIRKYMKPEDQMAK